MNKLILAALLLVPFAAAAQNAPPPPAMKGGNSCQDTTRLSDECKLQAPRDSDRLKRLNATPPAPGTGLTGFAGGLTGPIFPTK